MPGSKKVLIASDHAGVDLKAAIQKGLPDWTWVDLGPETHASVDYPDYAALLAKKIEDGDASQGVLICGSGVGMAMSANKFRHIRATLVENPVTARLSRQHNDANVLCLGSRILAPEYAIGITRVFLETPFSGEPRHQARIDKIGRLELEDHS
ncbi:MAG: ribose 5-phosphate isomerase B [Oligoflexia bacterium]|nr:ribose 5-phosphate isomerase B [Oligoflexia bacterium]